MCQRFIRPYLPNRDLTSKVSASTVRGKVKEKGPRETKRQLEYNFVLASVIHSVFQLMMMFFSSSQKSPSCFSEAKVLSHFALWVRYILHVIFPFLPNSIMCQCVAQGTGSNWF